jgi:hypothetical protein
MDRTEREIGSVADISDKTQAIEDRKDRFDALNVLRSAAWSNFDARRGYEWKFSFALWTALALLCGALITLDASESPWLKGNWPALLGTIWIAITVVVVHAGWSVGCKLRNDRDRRLSYLYEEEMCPLAGVTYADVIAVFHPKSTARDATPPPDGFLAWLWARAKALGNYWHACQILITALLALACYLAMRIRVYAL